MTVHWTHRQVQLGDDVAMDLNMFTTQQNESMHSGTANSVELRGELQRLHPEVLYFSFGRASSQDLATMHFSKWKELCAAVCDNCPSLSRLSFTIPCNKQSIPFAAVFLESVSTKRITKFSLADNFSNYADRLNVAQLPNLEVLALRNTCKQNNVLALGFCRSLASRIRSLPYLREMHLSHFCFPSDAAWEIVKEALRERAMLEDVRFHDVRITSKDVSHEALSDAVFVANRACVVHLREEMKIPAPFTLEQRLQAYLHIQKKEPSVDAFAQADIVDILKSIGDRLDYSYELLRNRVDPAQWAYE